MSETEGHGRASEPFERTELVDKPGIVGAKWWHSALADESSKIARRNAMRSIVVAGGVLAGFGALVAMCAKASSSGPRVGPGGLDPSEAKEERKTTLDTQRDFGWSFGAYEEALVFDGASLQPFDASAAAGLVDAMRPARTELRRYYLPTLFDAPNATPRAASQIDPELFATYKPLLQSVKPIRTPAMDAAFERGRAVSSLFDALRERGGAARDAKAALVVDLPGPEAVAFAAGASTVFDPVMLFDNWPHPRGVVKAHETLGAALFYQPLFDKERARPVQERIAKPAMFVLDRRRLGPYTDDATQFDNRFVAKLPSPAAAMSALGVAHVLYVVPTEANATQELEDLNDDFLLYRGSGLDVAALSLELLQKPAGGDAVYYGGTAGSHPSFFLDYPWAKPPAPATSRLAQNRGKDFVPVARQTAYSSGAASGSLARSRPPTFGTVPVIVAVGTGVVLGARYTRSGSWNRSGGGGWSS